MDEAHHTTADQDTDVMRTLGLVGHLRVKTHSVSEAGKVTLEISRSDDGSSTKALYGGSSLRVYDDAGNAIIRLGGSLSGTSSMRNERILKACREIPSRTCRIALAQSFLLDVEPPSGEREWVCPAIEADDLVLLQELLDTLPQSSLLKRHIQGRGILGRTPSLENDLNRTTIQLSLDGSTLDLFKGELSLDQEQSRLICWQHWELSLKEGEKLHGILWLHEGETPYVSFWYGGVLRHTISTNQ